MSDQAITFSSLPSQTLKVQLTVDDESLTLNLALNYSVMAGYWQMQISDSDGNILVACVPLVTGWYPAANLLAQYGYMKIGSAYLLNTGNSLNDYPGLSDLDQFTLIWGDTAV